MLGMSKSREIHTWYTDAGDVEHDIVIKVSSLDLGDTPFTGLPDMPADEEDRLREHVAELYWAEEREAYEMSQCAQEDSRDE